MSATKTMVNLTVAAAVILTACVRLSNIQEPASLPSPSPSVTSTPDPVQPSSSPEPSPTSEVEPEPSPGPSPSPSPSDSIDTYGDLIYRRAKYITLLQHTMQFDPQNAERIRVLEGEIADINAPMDRERADFLHDTDTNDLAPSDDPVDERERVKEDVETFA